MPRHVQAALIGEGHMTEDHLTHRARPRTCKDCWAALLAGVDDLGTDAIVDDAPLTVRGELQALLAGKRTWALCGQELCARDEWFIQRFTADTLPVYAAHQCGTALPENTPHIHTDKAAPDYSEIPF